MTLSSPLEGWGLTCFESGFHSDVQAGPLRQSSCLNFPGDYRHEPSCLANCLGGRVLPKQRENWRGSTHLCLRSDPARYFNMLINNCSIN